MSMMPEDENSCTTVVLPVTTVANDDGVSDKLVLASDAETIIQVVGSMAPQEDEDDADMSMESDTKEYDSSVDQMSCLENSMALTADGLMLPPEGADGDTMENSGQIIVSQSSCDGSAADEPQQVTLVTDMCSGGIAMETGQQVMISASDLGGSVGGSMVRQQDGSIALVNASGGVAPPLLLMAEQLSAAGVTLPDGTAIQNMLATHGSATFTGSNGETIQIITVNHPDQDGSEPTDGLGGGVVDVINLSGPVLHDSIAGILMPPPQLPQNLPPGCPTWAARLKDCEQIGDSFRGWVETEVELDLVLTFHKQQTQSFWGTRQSPSPAKQSTRLMWKSQYVPFDGIPFINAGSRAVVMECQYGPRRKGSHLKRQAIATQKPSYCFTQTCPARIYIKKVRKFPEFAVDLNMDKKSLKLAMDKSFHMLKAKGNLEHMGEERFYVQLPTEKAHEFHSESSNSHPPQPPTDRLHPRIIQKIRDLVASGETRLYVIRKNLRRFVEKELFGTMDQMPEKHNLSYYPTVNDLQNNIHQALQDIESGLLPVTAQMVNMEVVTSSDGGDSQELPPGLWQSVSDDQPHAETVTVTLTQCPGEDGQHIISRVETHLSDGSTQMSTSLTPETVRLLAKLHPNIFPTGSLLQFRDGSTQPIPVSSRNIVLDTSTLQQIDPSDLADNKDNIDAEGDQPLTISTVSNEMIAVPQSIVLNAGMTESVVHNELGKVIMQVPYSLQPNSDLCCGDVTTAIYQHHQIEPHEMVDGGDMMSKQLEADGASINVEFSSEPDTCIKLEDDNDVNNDNKDNDVTNGDMDIPDEQEES